MTTETTSAAPNSATTTKAVEKPKPAAPAPTVAAAKPAPKATKPKGSDKMIAVHQVHYVDADGTQRVAPAGTSFTPATAKERDDLTRAGAIRAPTPEELAFAKMVAGETAEAPEADLVG